MEEKLEAAIRDWKETLQVANALYQLYKQHRERLDGLESRIRELVQTEPLTTKDWLALRARVEQHERDTQGQGDTGAAEDAA